ncbi:MAG: leucine-rich repeat domain-containing protein [Bacteroidales bacterium]|nr:leucine-rich repeat domain-containing protein [Bacteroidales bacterium]
MKRLKYCLFAAFLFLAGLNARAYDFVANDLAMNILTETTVEVAGNPNNLSAIVIPSSVTYDGVTYSVVAVGNSAFANDLNVRSVQLGSNVATIGDMAFYYCSNLEQVSFPANLTSIGTAAFYYCISLGTVSLPEGLTYLGEHAFHYCTSLTSVSLPSSLTTVSDYTFMACSSLNNISIAEGLQTVSQSAFSNCTSVSSLTFPSTISSFGAYAFSNCTNLSSLRLLASNPPQVEATAFYGLGNFNVEIPCRSDEAYLSAEIWRNIDTVRYTTDCEIDTVVEVITACDSLIFFDSVLTSSGTYYYTEELSETSFRETKLQLTIKQSYTKTIDTILYEGRTLTYDDENYFVGESFTAGGTYTSSIEGSNGCDSTLVLNISVLQFVDSTIDAEICQGETFTLGNIQATETGVYEIVRHTSEADTLVTLNLVVLPSYDTVIYDTVKSASFDADYMEISVDSLQTVNGCDSVVTFSTAMLVIKDTIYDYQEMTACGSYDFYGEELTESGTYTHAIPLTAKKDFLISLDLTILPQPEPDTLEESIDMGETYDFNGTELTSAGTYTDTIVDANGCDVVTVLTLTVNPVDRITIYDTTFVETCAEATGEGTPVTETYTNVQGFDSIIVTYPVSYYADTTTLTETICKNSPYNENGFDIEQATENVYYLNLTGIGGCDSLVVLNFNYHPEYNTVITERDTVTECALNNERDTVIESYQSIYGCDSIVTKINQKVFYVKNDTASHTMCSGDRWTYYPPDSTVSRVFSDAANNYRFTWEEVDRTTSVVKRCSHTAIITVNVNPSYDTILVDTVYAYDANGNIIEGWGQSYYSDTVMDYQGQTVNGCDSIVRKVIFYKDPVDSSLVGLNTISKEDIVLSIVPNPAKEVIMIKAENTEMGDILILDNAGRIAKTIRVATKEREVRVDVSDLNSGIYYVRMGNISKKLIIE